MNWYLDVLKKYAVFNGRARRKEYWMFFLVNIIVSLVLAFVDSKLGLFNPEVGIGTLGTIYGLAILLPAIGVSIRRLHDTGRSGWWMLIGFVPLIGGIVLLVFFVFDSTPGSNEYGPNPKGVGN
jgi:uncharacterized membrane protein YhaH (DUF805 family)